MIRNVYLTISHNNIHRRALGVTINSVTKILTFGYSSVNHYQHEREGENESMVYSMIYHNVLVHQLVTDISYI